MTSFESRAGEKDFGPLQLKSIWREHSLRDFDLRVIIQVSGCEEIAQKVIQGDHISESEKAPLEIANDLAKQKGYLPIFNVSKESERVSEGAEEILQKFFDSREWLNRDPSQTRQL